MVKVCFFLVKKGVVNYGRFEDIFSYSLILTLNGAWFSLRCVLCICMELRSEHLTLTIPEWMHYQKGQNFLKPIETRKITPPVKEKEISFINFVYNAKKKKKERKGERRT